MEINIPSKFVKLDNNVVQGDLISLLDEGNWVEMEGKEGVKEVLQFKVKLPNGEQKLYTMNNTTIKNLTQEWGKDSKTWIGKELKVWGNRQTAFGKKIKVLILAPSYWAEAFKDDEDYSKGQSNEDIPIIEDNEVKSFQKQIDQE